MSEYYDEANDRRVRKTWEEVRRSLTQPDGGEAIMLHDFSREHVYFMQNEETSEIKIGMSIHPEIRRQQLRQQERANMKVLHIYAAGGRQLEEELHRKFKNLRSRNRTKEWFHPDLAIFEFIEEMKIDPLGLKSVN